MTDRPAYQAFGTPTWERDALEEVRRWALSAARFPDDFEREFGFPVGREERGRQDAYRAVLGIIDRHAARAFHERVK